MRKIYFILILLFISSTLFAQETTYYVATNGNNKNEGTLLKPFQNLEYALSKVASAKSSKVSILLKEGYYPQENTITITPEILAEHELKIAAHDNGKVVISGTVQIEPKWERYKGEIVKASIGIGRSVDQLLIDGNLLQMARYPNYDNSQRVFNGTAEDAISPERIAKWTNPAGGYVHALHQGEWGGFHYKILGKDKSGELNLEGGWQNNRPSPLHKEYRFVENVFEELDAPGEWFYNSKEGIFISIPTTRT